MKIGSSTVLANVFLLLFGHSQIANGWTLSGYTREIGNDKFCLGKIGENKQTDCFDITDEVVKDEWKGRATSVKFTGDNLDEGTCTMWIYKTIGDCNNDKKGRHAQYGAQNVLSEGRERKELSNIKPGDMWAGYVLCTKDGKHSSEKPVKPYRKD